MRKTMFTGWQHVFGFTLKQAVGKTFRTVTLSLAIGLLAIGASANIIMAYLQEKNDEISAVETVYVLDESGLGEIDWTNEALDREAFPKVHFERSEKTLAQLADDLKETDRQDVILQVQKEKEGYRALVYLPYKSKLKKDDAKKLGKAVRAVIRKGILNESGIGEEQLGYITCEVNTDFMKIGEDEKSEGVRILVLLLPMLFICALYFMLLIYGQNMGNIVSVEKSSKLMETMLVMTRPYGIILGKISATAVVALGQIFLWIFSGIAGFFLGDLVSRSLIYPGYENKVIKLLNTIAEQNGSGAFGTSAMILAGLSLCVGFLFYCVLAGMIASFASKAEEVSQVMSYYMMIMMFGFFGSYTLPMNAKNWVLVVLRLVPFTSAYLLPGDILVGNIPVWQGALYLLLLFVCTMALAVLAGIVYKSQVFYRGQNVLKKLFAKGKKEQEEDAGQEWQIVSEQSQAEILNKPKRAWYFVLAVAPGVIFYAVSLGLTMLLLTVSSRITFGGVDWDQAVAGEIAKQYEQMVLKLSPMTLFLTHVACITIFATWYYLAYVRKERRPKRKIGAGHVKLTVFLAAVGALLVFFADGTVFLESYLIPSVVEKYMDMAKSVGLGSELPATLAAVFLAPVGEEFICRGVCLRYGKKAFQNFWIANFVQALLFGLMHGNWVQGIYAFFIGLVLGILADRYQTLIPCMFVHFVINSASASWAPVILSKIEPSIPVSVLMVTVPAVLITGLLFVTSGGKRKEASVQV